MKFPFSIAHNIAYRCIVLMFVLFGLFLVNVQAKTVYITDSLFIGLHKGRSIDSEILKVLPTGTALEVIKRDGNFVNVRDTEGTTGWINNYHIISHDPKKNMSLNKSSEQSKIKELKAQLKNIKTQWQKSDTQPITDPEETNRLKNDNKSLENSVKQLTETNAQMKNEISILQKTNKTNGADTDIYKLPYAVIFSVISLLLLLGFLFGIIFINWRRKRRYSGLRF